MTNQPCEQLKVSRKEERRCVVLLSIRRATVDCSVGEMGNF